MPYVQVRVSVSLDSDQIKTLQEALSSAITLIPGKTPAVTMLEIIPDCNIYLGKYEDGDCALVDIAVNNTPDKEDLVSYSKAVCNILNEVTGIKKERMYLTHRSNPEWHTGRMFLD